MEEDFHKECQTAMQSLHGPEITCFWELGADVVEFSLWKRSAFTRSVMMVIFTIMFQTQDTLKVLFLVQFSCLYNFTASSSCLCSMLFKSMVSLGYYIILCVHLPNLFCQTKPSQRHLEEVCTGTVMLPLL